MTSFFREKIGPAVPGREGGKGDRNGRYLEGRLTSPLLIPFISKLDSGGKRKEKKKKGKAMGERGLF